MYTLQTEMTFSKSDLNKDTFAGGKNKAKQYITFPRVTGNIFWSNNGTIGPYYSADKCESNVRGKNCIVSVSVSLMFRVGFLFYGHSLERVIVRHMPNDWGGISMKHFHFNNSFRFLDERLRNRRACTKMNHKSQKYCPKVMPWLQREFVCTYGQILA